LRKKQLHDKAFLVLQIHDELVYEVKEEHVSTVRDIIEDAMRSAIARSPVTVALTDVPLDVSSAVGNRLDELK
jgi:DNA polymerase I-like protein with 3'-5' exonuclease and polymerase domains